MNRIKDFTKRKLLKLRQYDFQIKDWCKLFVNTQYNIYIYIYIIFEWKLYWLIFHIFIRMIVQSNSYVYFKIYFKREKKRETERESLNRSIFHASPCDNIKKSNIFLIAAPHLYSVAVVLWMKYINKLSSCKLLQRELLRCSRKQRPNIVRLVHEYKLSVLIAFFKESVWEIWSINTRNDLTVF